MPVWPEIWPQPLPPRHAKAASSRSGPFEAENRLTYDLAALAVQIKELRDI